MYLEQTVAHAAQLRRELAGGVDDGQEETVGDLQQVALVLLQALGGLQPAAGEGGGVTGTHVTAGRGEGPIKTSPP